MMSDSLHMPLDLSVGVTRMQPDCAVHLVIQMDKNNCLSLAVSTKLGSAGVNRANIAIWVTTQTLRCSVPAVQCAC